MNFYLRSLIKRGFERQMDGLIIKELKMSLAYDGSVCKKCGIIQGIENKGVKKYYCGHLSARIDKKLKKESEEITKRVFLFTIFSSR